MKTAAASAALTALLAGCGSSGETGGSEVGTGSFLDSPVEGLRFEASSGLTGVSGANGEFLYRRGDSVRFYLGKKLYLGAGSVGTDGVITPESMFASTNATRLMRILQSIDENGNPDDLR